MSFTSDELYKLLPAVYRVRDAERGMALEALIAVVAEQAGVLESDVERLYENWFIETCEDQLVPYIGDFLGVRSFHPIATEARISQRARIANTLRYRRRKGTATVLEQLAFDTTGWRARAVEFFELLGTTQHYNHVRLHNSRTPDIRRTDRLELLNTAFDTIAHTGDVRHIASDRGRHNIPNVGLFLWRLQSYFVSRASASPVTTPGDGRYRFDPLGEDRPLFNRPQTETEITHLADEIHVPGMLRRRPLYDELESRRQAITDTRTPEAAYFGDQRVFEVYVQLKDTDPLRRLDPEEVLICHLAEPPIAVPEVWMRPPAIKKYQRSDGSGEQSFEIAVAVDPVQGRLAFPHGVTPHQVRVSYAYGFSADVGGGPYDRRGSIAEALTRNVDWQIGVSKEIAPEPDEIVPTVTEAVTAWNSEPAGKVGVIALMDNSTYEETVPEIRIKEGSQLLIVAAKWPKVEVSDEFTVEERRVAGRFEPDDLRPHVSSDVKVKGVAPADSPKLGELMLDGLLVAGKLTATGRFGKLRVAHSTLVPKKGGLSCATGDARLAIEVVRSICGPINLGLEAARLRVAASIVDNVGATAIKSKKTPLELQESTVFGEVEALSIEASNSIFTDAIDIIRRQEGCIRFSYVADGSKTPRCFRCQPQFALFRLAESLGLETAADLSTAQINQVKGRVRPGFTSTTYGTPAFAQLRRSCPVEIRTGADDGAEMGVFNSLKQPQREANLRSAMDEYLRFGLEAGVIYVT
jgi:hypothetical protein